MTMFVPILKAASRFRGDPHARPDPPRAITKVGLVGVIDDQFAVEKQTQPLRRFAVMFVDLRRSVGEIEMAVVNRMIEGQFDEVRFGQDTLHLPAERSVHAVVVIGMQETSRLETQQLLHLAFSEADVAMTVQIKIWAAEKARTGRVPPLPPAAVTTSVFSAMKLRRFGSEEGSEYQSPPPPYLTRAILKGSLKSGSCAEI